MLRTLLFALVLTLGFANQSLAIEPLILMRYGDAYHAIQKYNVNGIFVFTASWCEPCKKMKKDTWTPLMSQIKTKYIIYFVDVEAEPDIVKKWQAMGMVQNIPAYALTTRGGTRIISYDAGYRNKSNLMKWVNDGILSLKKRRR